MSLPNDISRCAGRLSLEPANVSICPDRNTCRRYTEMIKDVTEHPNARSILYPMAMNLADADGTCRMRIAA